MSNRNVVFCVYVSYKTFYRIDGERDIEQMKKAFKHLIESFSAFI